MLVKVDNVEDHDSVCALERLSYSRSERSEVAEILLHIDGTDHSNNSLGDLLRELGTALYTITVSKAVVIKTKGELSMQ